MERGKPSKYTLSVLSEREETKNEVEQIIESVREEYAANHVAVFVLEEVKDRIKREI